MNHPVIMQANAQVRYDGMLEAAETRRRIRRLARQDLGMHTRIRSFVSDVRRGLFDWLKVRRRMDAEMAVLND